MTPSWRNVKSFLTDRVTVMHNVCGGLSPDGWRPGLALTPGFVNTMRHAADAPYTEFAGYPATAPNG
jgi:hypothetical protein